MQVVNNGFHRLYCSLHTRMNAAARLMQPLRCSATHLKISQRFLQHASNTQRTQALARQAQRTAQHARRFSRTCTLFTRPRVTRSITISAQLHDMRAMGKKGRRSDQSLARERHTGEHEAHSPTRKNTLLAKVAEGRQRLLPTVTRGKPLL